MIPTRETNKLNTCEEAMSRPTLDENTIQTYAQYTQALMLLVGAFKGLPDLQGTFNTIYPPVRR